MGSVISLEERRREARMPVVDGGSSRDPGKQAGFGRLVYYPEAYLMDTSLSGNELRLLCAYFEARAFDTNVVPLQKATEIRAWYGGTRQAFHKARARLVDLGYLKIFGHTTATSVVLVRLEDVQPSRESDTVTLQVDSEQTGRPEVDPTVNPELTTVNLQLTTVTLQVDSVPDQPKAQPTFEAPLQAIQAIQTYDPECAREDRTKSPFDANEWTKLQQVAADLGLNLVTKDIQLTRDYPGEWRSWWADYSPEDREHAIRCFADEPTDQRQWWKRPKTLIARLLEHAGEHKIRQRQSPAKLTPISDTDRWAAHLEAVKPYLTPEVLAELAAKPHRWDARNNRWVLGPPASPASGCAIQYAYTRCRFDWEWEVQP